MAKLGTKAELDALALAALSNKHLASLYAKLTKPKPTRYRAPIQQIEQALVESSAGIVLPAVGGPSYWAMQSARYGDLGATVDDAWLVGRWLATQGWAQGRQYTVDTLVKWWPNFLAKAKANNGNTAPTERQDWTPE